MIERPATEDDVPSLVDLYCRYDETYRGFPDTDADDVLRDWAVPGFDLRTGTLVLEQEGTILGYAVVDGEEADSVTAVHRPDLAPRLLAWLEGRGTRVEHYAPDTDPDLNAAFEQRGWDAERRFWRMRRELDDRLPEPVWPTRVELRDYDRPRDDVAVHRLITECFREIGGQHERTLDQWRNYLLDTEKFDPSLYLVAEQDGVVVGASLSQVTGDYGFVRQLAVAPSQRGRGLALALLHESFRRHVGRGLPATALGVDAANPTGALRLYEKAGMRVHEQFTRWEHQPPTS